VKTTFAFSLACALALSASAQTAPPAFPAPPPASANDAALREAVRRSIATGSNVVIKPVVPAARPPAASAAANSPAPATQPAPPALTAPGPETTPPTSPAPGTPPTTGPTSPPPGGSPVPQPAGPPAMQPPALSGPAGGSVAPSAPTKPAEELLPITTIDWPSADLSLVFEMYQRLTMRTVLRPGNLPPATIVLTIAAPMTRQEVIQALNSVLAMNGISMIPVGEKFVKAVPMTQAIEEGAPFQRLGEELLPELGPYVTHMVQLKYARPSELVPVLQLFSKVKNGILPIDSSQVLVLRDYTENVKRMLELIKEVDVVVPSEFVSEVIPIKYAMASDIAAALNSLSSGGGGTSVGGTGAGAGARTGATRGMGTTGANRFGTGLQGQPGATPYGGVPGQPGQPGAQPSFQSRLQDIIKKASTTGSGEVQVLGPTKIIADERANALMVFASRMDMNTITNIVAKLDVVLPQVLIESVIMGVDLSDSRSFGVSYAGQPKQAGNYFTGVGAVNNVGFLQPSSFSALTNGLGSLGQGFSYYGQLGQDLDVTLTAAASDSRVTVIQKPRIMTFHAKPASFFIGNTVPYVTSTSYYGGYGYGGGPSSQYQQLKVGIGLDVTPYINQDGLVVMEINEQIEEISGSTAIANVGNVPNTASRTLTAQVAVRDRETIILGGFIRTSNTKDKSGVPLLKDIPVLGLLFNSSSRSTARSELVVLIRPTVMRTPELAATMTKEEKLRLPGIGHAEVEDKRTEDRTAARMKKELADEEKKLAREGEAK
jgi:general secretion pathway protein D